MDTKTHKISVYFAERNGYKSTDQINVEIPMNSSWEEERRLKNKAFLDWLEDNQYDCGWSNIC